MIKINTTQKFRENNIHHQQNQKFDKILPRQIDYIISLSSREDTCDPQVAFFNSKNLKLDPKLKYNRYCTNIKSEDIDLRVNSYFDYLKLCFFENQNVGIKAEWIYFEMLRKISNIIVDNPDEFRDIYNGRSDYKIQLLHIFDLESGFSMEAMASDLSSQMMSNVRFNDIITNLSSSIESKTSFNLMSMFSGKNYYEYFAFGFQGSQGPPIPPPKKYDGFKSIIILDDIKMYQKLKDNINYLIEFFAKNNNEMMRYLQICKSFIEKLSESINHPRKNSSKSFLWNILVESESILNIKNNLLVTLNYAEDDGSHNPYSHEFSPHDISFGICMVKNHLDMDLKVPEYGWVMWQRYFEINKYRILDKSKLLGLQGVAGIY